jgi:hypothetical protein
MDLVENPYVSDFTKKTLEQFDWKQGDPIPDELGDVMLKIKDKLPPSTRVDVLIEKDLMSEADVEKVQSLLKDAKELLKSRKKAEELDTATKNMSPSVREAYEKMAADSAPQIVDDREEVAAAEEKAPEPADVPIDPAIENKMDTGADQMVILPFCPRCGWDMRQKFDTDITDKDKEDFLATLLGGARFKRDYKLVGGKMIVRLRSMLADENFLVQRQLLLDQQAGEILSEAEWFVRMAEYRMACSLEGIFDADGKALVANPELGDVPFTPPADKPTQTVLTVMRQNVNTKALAQEVTRRLISVQLRKFQRLVEALEAMALEPSFWDGIESQL